MLILVNNCDFAAENEMLDVDLALPTSLYQDPTSMAQYTTNTGSLIAFYVVL